MSEVLSEEEVKQEIVKHEQSQSIQQLQPLSPEDAKKQMETYQEYVEALLDESDSQDIQGKKFKKKSAWRKLAMANSLSVSIVTERREELENGDFAYHFTCRALAPNGRYTDGSGSCTAYEKADFNGEKWLKYNKSKARYEDASPNTLHNVRSTAETRAWNRSVSNMIAAGEVSAEEMPIDSTPPKVYASKEQVEQLVELAEQLGKDKAYLESSVQSLTGAGLDEIAPQDANVLIDALTTKLNNATQPQVDENDNPEDDKSSMDMALESSQ